MSPVAITMTGTNVAAKNSPAEGERPTTFRRSLGDIQSTVALNPSAKRNAPVTMRFMLVVYRRGRVLPPPNRPLTAEFGAPATGPGGSYAW